MTIRTKRGIPCCSFGGDFDNGGRLAALVKAVMQPSTVTQEHRAEFWAVASYSQLMWQKWG